MKSKKRVIFLCLILLVIVITIFLLIRKGNKAEIAEISYKDVRVSNTTIENTLTSSGEVTSEAIILTLNTYRYFKEIYYSEGSYISKGSKILKYTNGKYYTAPYDLVLVSYNLPESKKRISSNHNLQVKAMNTLTMSLSIDETEIDKVNVGQEVIISLNAYEEKTYSGKISFINQIGSYSSSGTKYIATVEFDNDGNVKLGMSGSVSITVEKAENVIAVPIEAIQTNKDVKYVVVVDGETTKNVTVETGISNAAYVEVKSGLDGSETVRMINADTSSTNSYSFNRKSDFEGFENMPVRPNDNNQNTSPRN